MYLGTIKYLYFVAVLPTSGGVAGRSQNLWFIWGVEVTVLFLSLVFQLEMKPQGRLLMEAKYYLERSGESLALLAVTSCSATTQNQIIGPLEG